MTFNQSFRAVVFAAVVFFSGSVFLSSQSVHAADSATAVASGKYANKEKGFSITFPKNWETKEGIAGAVVASLSPRESDSDNFRENVNIVIEDLPKDLTSEEYYQAGIVNLRKVPDFKEDQKGKITIDGKEAVWLIASHKSSNVSAKMIQYYVVKGKKAYVITGTALADSFGKYKPQFDQIAQSFKSE